MQATQLLLSAHEHLKQCSGSKYGDGRLAKDVENFLKDNVFPRTQIMAFSADEATEEVGTGTQTLEQTRISDSPMETKENEVVGTKKRIVHLLS